MSQSERMRTRTKESINSDSQFGEAELIRQLQDAWQWRQALGYFQDSQAVRVFHGPGEGSGALKNIALDRFGNHYWLTFWEASQSSGSVEAFLKTEGNLVRALIHFLQSQGAVSIVGLMRPQRGVPSEPFSLWGTPPEGRFSVSEGPLEFLIQLHSSLHPGLFLDHQPLRRWLLAHSEGARVLNLFAYTGSLSVAAARGGASHITNLDLSRPSLQWAEENLKLNKVSLDRVRTLSGDVFEWLPRLLRQKQVYDLVILDPPSFSRSKKGSFSVAKDLRKLHELVLPLVAPGGILITSMNSSAMSWAQYEQEVQRAALDHQRKLLVLSEIDVPETFPTPLGRPQARYLKGWILRVLSGDNS